MRERGEGRGGRDIAYIIDMDYPMLVLLNLSKACLVE